MKLSKAELKELKKSRSLDGLYALVDALVDADEVEIIDELIVEDEADLSATLEYNLQAQGFSTTVAATGLAALAPDEPDGTGAVDPSATPSPLVGDEAARQAGYDAGYALGATAGTISVVNTRYTPTSCTEAVTTTANST